MKAIFRNIKPCDFEKAANAAIAADKHYRQVIGPKEPMILGKIFFVHETATGTIVVNYKK